MKLVLPLAVPLLMISVRKIDSTAIAAEARGFHLRTRSIPAIKLYPFHLRDAAAVLARRGADGRRNHSIEER